MENIQINKLHTTALGVERIKSNLSLTSEDVVVWCKQAVNNATPDNIVRKGKNWYINGSDYAITINAHSHTIITAHKIRSSK